VNDCLSSSAIVAQYATLRDIPHTDKCLPYPGWGKLFIADNGCFWFYYMVYGYKFKPPTDCCPVCNGVLDHTGVSDLQYVDHNFCTCCGFSFSGYTAFTTPTRSQPYQIKTACIRTSTLPYLLAHEPADIATSS